MQTIASTLSQGVEGEANPENSTFRTYNRIIRT